MKLLIIGASGVLGTRLYKDALKKKWKTAGTYYSKICEDFSCLDLGNGASIDRIFNSFRPEAVVLAGGITNVDLCEEKPKLAEDVNIKGTIDVIRNVKEYGARLVYLSTDYIFNGENGPYKEEDKPSPINVYGRTKLEAENCVRSSLKDYLILRTVQLYGFDRSKKNFATKIILNMRAGKKVYAAEDLYSTPTYAGSLSGAVMELLEKGVRGIFNAAGADFLNRYEYVSVISEIFKLDKGLIESVRLKDLSLKAKRPMRAGLKIDKLKKLIAEPLRGCEEGLKLFKKEFI